MKNWIKAEDLNNNIVLSSRIRLARNLKSVPFPDRLDENKAKEIIQEVEKAFYVSSDMKETYSTVNLWEHNEIDNNAYLEKHFISPKLLSNKKKAAFFLDKDETVSIMINEEDHIRLQCITAELDIEACYEVADKLDNLLEESLDYAFSEKYGYLTACPTNLGTGMRASVMIHLPALAMNNSINGVLGAVTQVGMTVRGLYGEGSKAEGNLFQISNQISLGLSEYDILNNLNAVVTQIINQENWTREQLIKNSRYELEDQIFRALGVLKSAVLIGSKEGLNLLSLVRMGVEMDIIKDVNKQILNSLIVDIQPAALQKLMKDKMSRQERDYSRARLIREKLN